MRKVYFALVLLLLMLGAVPAEAQQDPQYTQYMYNTQVVNPAYAGNREVLSFGVLGRTQWVDIDGAPKTGTFTVNGPIGSLENMGLGLSIVHDQLGPAVETNITVDYSYSLYLSAVDRLTFGLKGGIDVLDVDFSKLNIFDITDPRFQNNIDNKLQPQVGAGIYYNTDHFYAGLSVPNFLTTQHFDESSLSSGSSSQSIAAERLHYFLIMGYVWEISRDLKFKPATMVKAVSGTPLQWDLSANFMLYDKLTLGASYRWSAAMSAMVGFQVSDGLFLGVAYDYTTTELENYSSGSYEFFLRFDILNRSERVLSPRFF